MNRGLSVVIPVYNSEESLPRVLAELAGELPRRADAFEVILVNDGSGDRSWDVIAREAATRPFVRGINLMRNYGQHNALLAGVRQARFDVTVTMDDDLQHPPSEIAALLDKLAEGHDVVYGAPRAMQHDLLRAIASRITKLALGRVMGAGTANNASAFRAFRTDLRGAFATYQNPFVSLDVLLTWGTSKFTSVSVRHEPRQYGQSNYTVRKLMTHATNMITGFSALPLQIATLVGFSFTLFGMASLAYVVFRYFAEGGSVPGFPFLASLISIFSGAQMFALGVIGEYLGRMHGRLLDRPSYAVRTEVGGASVSADAAALEVTR